MATATMTQTWQEMFFGGSPEAEALFIKDAVKEILLVQADLKSRAKAPVIRRAFHAKIHAGVRNATFRVAPDVPEEYRVGLFQPGLAGEQSPGLSVRFMGINRNAISSYLISLYCSLAVLTEDALAVLDDVEIGKYHDYPDTYK